MSTTVPLALRDASNKPQFDRPSAISSRMAFGITVVICGAIILALAWVLPPASSYRTATPAPQWITGL